MKSKDPDCKIPISKEEFRCNNCDYPASKEVGKWYEIEPGLAAMVCPDCYKPKKDPYGKEEKKESIVDVGSAASEGSECSTLQHVTDDVRASADL